MYNTVTETHPHLCHITEQYTGDKSTSQQHHWKPKDNGVRLSCA